MEKHSENLNQGFVISEYTWPHQKSAHIQLINHQGAKGNSQIGGTLGKAWPISCGANSHSDLESPFATSFLPDNNYVASFHRKGILVIWDAGDCRPVQAVALDYEREWLKEGKKFQREDSAKALFAANGGTLVTEHITRDYSNRTINRDVHVWDLTAIDLSRLCENSEIPPTVETVWKRWTTNNAESVR